MNGCEEIVISPDRPNIRLSVRKVGNDLQVTFQPLIRQLFAKQRDCERVLILASTSINCLHCSITN
eukprot:m.91462 g.91462  ORF g.91462 m.91462 type:complete len:66 (+) comp36696_c0_seq10:762-959(+)